MKPKIKDIWMKESRTVLYGHELRLDWDNDRHHSVSIKEENDCDAVAEALYMMAAMIKEDKHLQEVELRETGDSRSW